MGKFRLAVATALAVLASGGSPEECAAGAGRCAAAAASVSDSTIMLQVPIRKHKGRGPQGDNPNVALLGDEVGKERELSTTRGEFSYSQCTSSTWQSKTACNSYGTHTYHASPSSCGSYCGGGSAAVVGNTYYYSVGDAGDCRCCSSSPSMVPTSGAWTTYQCTATPVPCQMTAWSAWTDCSKSCGGGTRSHSRTVTSHAKFGGTCDKTEGSEPCNVSPCPVDCKLSDWGGWGACSETCGSGKRSRSRTETTSAAHGGKACEKTEDEEDCSDKPCPAVFEAAPTTTTTTTTKGRCVCKNYECRESQFLAGDGGFESDCASATGDGTSPIACNALRNIARKSFCDWQ